MTAVITPYPCAYISISPHFERGPLQYALGMDWLAEAVGFEPLHRAGLKNLNKTISGVSA